MSLGQSTEMSSFKQICSSRYQSFQCFFTVSVSATECDGLPPASVPVTVIVKAPVGVEVEVAMVSVELPEPPPIDAGLKLAVAPAGRPLALRFTVSANPPEGLTVIVEL